MIGKSQTRATTPMATWRRQPAELQAEVRGRTPEAMRRIRGIKRRSRLLIAALDEHQLGYEKSPGEGLSSSGCSALAVAGGPPWPVLPGRPSVPAAPVFSAPSPRLEPVVPGFLAALAWRSRIPRSPRRSPAGTPGWPGGPPSPIRHFPRSTRGSSGSTGSSRINLRIVQIQLTSAAERSPSWSRS